MRRTSRISCCTVKCSLKGIWSFGYPNYISWIKTKQQRLLIVKNNHHVQQRFHWKKPTNFSYNFEVSLKIDFRYLQENINISSMWYFLECNMKYFEEVHNTLINHGMMKWGKGRTPNSFLRQAICSPSDAMQGYASTPHPSTTPPPHPTPFTPQSCIGSWEENKEQRQTMST